MNTRTIFQVTPQPIAAEQNSRSCLYTPGQGNLWGTDTSQQSCSEARLTYTPGEGNIL